MVEESVKSFLVLYLEALGISSSLGVSSLKMNVHGLSASTGCGSSELRTYS